MDNNRIIKVVDDNGVEKDMYIIFVTKLESFNKNYIFYTDPTDEEGQVFVSSYNDEQQLFPIEKPEEWEELERVFNQFIEDSKKCGGCHGQCSGDCDGECEGDCDCDGTCSCHE